LINDLIKLPKDRIIITTHTVDSYAQRWKQATVNDVHAGTNVVASESHWKQATANDDRSVHETGDYKQNLFDK